MKKIQKEIEELERWIKFKKQLLAKTETEINIMLRELFKLICVDIKSRDANK